MVVFRSAVAAVAFLASLVSGVGLAADGPLAPGDHVLSFPMGELPRSYLVHVPPRYDPQKPTPVVLVLHGAMMNKWMMDAVCGLSKKADEAGFVVVYPDGTGPGGMLLTWNAGLFRGNAAEGKPDDVAFLARVLDELAERIHVDTKRVYATGLSNGGMMCYRLAAEMADRLAAIAPVAGTMAIDTCHPTRPVSVLHLHGTADALVPFDGPKNGTPKFLAFKSVDESIRCWVAADGCPEKPQVEELPDKAHDGTKVTKRTYGPGKDGAEVVLVVIDGGGHVWPGQPMPVDFLGKSTKQISANDLIWEFFEKHGRR